MKTFFTILLSSLAIAGVSADNQVRTDVIELIAKRHSGYCYDPSKTVSEKQLHSLIQAARWASSSYNDQPWNFIIFNKATNPEAYKKAFSTLVEANQEWAKNAQILILVVASSNARGEPNRFAQYDTGAASAQLSLQAVSLGLMAHQMGGYDNIKVKELFNIPDGYVPMSMIAVGYECTPSSLSKYSNERVPFEKNFFDGTWGKSFSPVSK